MARIGYGRASRLDQNPTVNTTSWLPMAATRSSSTPLPASSLPPQLDAAIRHLRAGDLLVITRLDRLGRSVKHLAALAGDVEERQVGLRVLHQGIDTTTAVGRPFFHMLAAIAEFERELIIERTEAASPPHEPAAATVAARPSMTPAAIDKPKKCMTPSNSPSPKSPPPSKPHGPPSTGHSTPPLSASKRRDRSASTALPPRLLFS